MSHPVVHAIIAAAMAGYAVAGPPVGSSLAILLAALAVAIIGVPHGGLDHWVGRRLLAPRLGGSWPFVFLPTYLLVGALVAFGWSVAPVQTVVLFFLVSAWHFGREDGLGHVAAVAVGGLVIWVPAIARPAEMEAILKSLILIDPVASAAQIVALTRIVAMFLLPVAAMSLVASGTRDQRLVGLTTAALGVAAPILGSFTWYFCGWHSVRGLRRMKTDENLSWLRFWTAVGPLSVSAIVLVVAAGWWAGESVTQPDMQTRILFIGLAAIAVPHLLLHEIEKALGLSRDVFRTGEVRADVS